MDEQKLWLLFRATKTAASLSAVEELCSRLQHAARPALSVTLCLYVCGKMPWQAELIGAVCAKLRNNSPPEMDGFFRRPVVCRPLSALALAERPKLPL